MKKGKRFERKKKRLINFLWFYITTSILMFTCYTFSKYTTTMDTTGGIINIAKFNVNVNDVTVGNGTPFELRLSPNSNTYNNKMAPSSTGYFEITINPNGTEVSLEYEFKIDLSNIDQYVYLTGYTINDGEMLNIENNNIKGEILLPNKNMEFTEQEKTTIKTYWKWDEGNIINPTITATDIKVTSLIKQKVN